MRAPGPRSLPALLLLQSVGLSLLLGTEICRPASATDWSQWRGSRADGSVSGSPRQGELPREPIPLWRRQIGGGYSGPLVADGRVWVHSRQGEEEVVSCLKLATGEVLWRRSYAAPFRQDSSARSHGLGPYATPVLREGRLFTFGVTSILMVWDAVDGRLLWRRDSAEEFAPAFPYFGAASSPLVWRDRVLVHLGGHPRGRMEDASSGAMVALRVADGSEIWRWVGDPPAVGATPVAFEVGGQPQIVFKTLRLMVGVDPRSGRELWRVPWPVREDNTIVTPLVLDGRLITSDFDRGLSAWAVESEGHSWTLRRLWESREASMSMSSPVRAGGMVVGFSHLHRGQLFVLDAATGEVTWRGPARRGEHATLVSWGDEVLVFADDGWLTVHEVEDRRLVELARYRLGDTVGWSHPAVADGGIVYRDDASLVVAALSPP